jgi:hypothetical protein
MIVETIFSTMNQEGQPNFAPMGVTWGKVEMAVRPFRNTTTFRNLVETGYGVVNVTDNVLLFAQSAVSRMRFPHFPAQCVPGVVLEDAAHWRELEVTNVDGGDEQAEIRCRVVGSGRHRDLLGFNRGKHAVIEVAILATRLHSCSEQEVWASLERYDEIVAKTGAELEKEAMRYLRDYVTRWYGASEG